MGDGPDNSAQEAEMRRQKEEAERRKREENRKARDSMNASRRRRNGRYSLIRNESGELGTSTKLGVKE